MSESIIFQVAFYMRDGARVLMGPDQRTIGERHADDNAKRVEELVERAREAARTTASPHPSAAKPSTSA